MIEHKLIFLILMLKMCSTIKSVLTFSAFLVQTTITETDEKALTASFVTLPEIINGKTCNAISSKEHKVEWPTTEDKTLSKPPCLNEAKEFTYRECSYGRWSLEPDCFYIQNETLRQCPDGFAEIEDICFQFTTKTTFPPACPFVDILPFDFYIDKIAHNISEPIWMPVKRQYTDGFDFLHWIELTYRYKLIFHHSYSYDDQIKSKDCLLYEPYGTQKAVSCSQQHIGVCAYKKLTEIDNNLCNSDSNCWQSDYSSKEKCFCYSEDLNDQLEAEFLQEYQNNVPKLITSETCTIGLRKTSEGKYIWKNSGQEIFYTHWSSDVVFDDTHIYGASSSSGWLLTQEPRSCFIIEKTVPISKIKLEFSYNSTDNVLTLKILNSSLDTTIFCFTNAHYFDFLYRYPQFSNSDEFNFKPLSTGPGHYWCEAFNSAEFGVVRTQKILVRNETAEFVAIFEVKYPSTNFNPLNLDTITYLKQIILDRFSKLRQDFTPRIMKIHDLYEKEHIMWVNIHFTSRKKIISSQVENQSKYLLSKIENNLDLYQNENLTLTSFYNTDFCLSERFDDMTWPLTPVGQEIYPLEFCFTIRGHLVSRTCSGNFISGARWSNIDKCRILQNSSLTDKLLEFYNKEVVVNSQSVTKFLEKYQLDLEKFNQLDVYLFSRILKKVYNDRKNPEINNFVKNINTILSFSRGALIESQLTAKSTDIFLSIIYNVSKNYQEGVEIIGNRFALLQYVSGDVSGVIIRKNSSSVVIEQLTEDWTFDRIKNEDGVFSAVWLSPELREEITNNSKIIFLLYFTDGFFGESFLSTNQASNVFGVILPDLNSEQLLPGPINIYEKITGVDKKTRTCSFWYYEVNKQAGFWYKYGTHIYDNQHHFCQFWYHSQNFALVASNNDFVESNMTSNLVDLLDIDYSDPERVDLLVNISENYDEFVPMDIFLFGKVLELVNETQIDLDALSKSVANLHKTNRTVLSQSQEEKQATDKILCYIDDIIRNYNTTSEVIHKNENFILFISDIQKKNFGGLVLLKENQNYEVEILRKEISFENLTNYRNIDSIIILSNQLRKQLLENPQIIITIFFNDSLFNTELSRHKHISTIYGVIVSETGNFSGPISIYHNISDDDDMEEIECSHWNFKESNQTSSYWEKNNQGLETSSFIQCDFWHTTHFALLILDKEVISTSNYKAVELITYINSGISVFGLFGIILTAILFKKWRKNIGNQILFNFTVAIMIQIFVFYGVTAFNTESVFRCTFLGALLQYSVIAQFSWMFVIAILQFKRFVKVFATSPKYLLVKACICGWGVPLIPVIISLVTDKNHYSRSVTGFCYPSGLGLYLGVWVPILMVIALNLCIFIYIMYNVVQRRIEPSNVCKSDGKYQWRLFVLLFFMLGMTWTFGFLAEFEFGTVFAYLFCLTATLQGFVLFLYFIVLNSNTRYMYTHALKHYCFDNNK